VSLQLKSELKTEKVKNKAMSNQPNTTNSRELHVVFGVGPLGQAVARELISRGKQVRMINRSGKAIGLPSGVEVVASDATDPVKVAQVTTGAYAVYQCAQPSYNEWVTKFPPFQASIIDGVARSGAKLIVAENLYMYGEVNGPMREDTPFNAHTRKGAVRAAMAESLMAAHKAGKVRATSARGSDFFGAGVLESAFGDRLFYPALAGKSAGLTGNIDLPHSVTYINDFGKTLAIIGEHDEALGQAWFVPNAPISTQREFTNMVFKEIGLPPKMSGMGKTMMTIGGIFIPAAREVIEMMYEFEKPFVVDSSRFERTFGVKATPWAESIKATIAWFKANPQVKH
jgi:nucleoside-diphosphate-sugar epimerase